MITPESVVLGVAASPSRHDGIVVTIADEGRVATLAVMPRAAAGVDDDELMRLVIDSLLSAGVVHGLDRELVAQVVAARDGRPHPVARCTPPTPPVDGHLELGFAEEAAADPLFTVAAGTLLARCTPPTAGADGVAVTGAPLHPPTPLAPSLSAGEGAEWSDVGDGITVVRALVGGRPRSDEGRVAVDEVLRVAALAHSYGPVRVVGSLEVGRGLPAGAEIEVTGSLRVAGDVERAHIQSGGGVRIEGSCLGSQIRAGRLGSAHHLLLDTLGDADGEMLAATRMGEQLVASAVASGRRLHAHDALRVVLASRFPDLTAALAAAARALRDPGVEVEERAADAIVQAAADAGAVAAGELVSLERFSGAARGLSRAVSLMGGAGAGDSDLEAAYLQGCQVETRGNLLLSGRGTYNVDARVARDLRALAPGATLRGGTLRVGGTLLTTELGAPAGAPVRVVLEGVGGARRLLAATAHPGVEVVCGDSTIVLEESTLNFSVGFDDKDNVVRSGDPLG